MDVNNNKKQLSILALTWPIFVETFLRMILGNVDTFMLGHYSDKAVAAVGAANQVNNMVLVVYSVISTGTLIVMSQYLGSNQRQKALDTAATSLAINLVLGLIMSAVLIIFAKPILRLLNIPEDIIGYGVRFLTIMGCASFFQALLSTTAAMMRSFGKTRVSMIVAVCMNILNVFGNSLFLYGFLGIPVLGVTGVAISTATTQAVAFFVVFFVVLGRIGIKLSLKSIRPFQRDIVRQVLSIGLPSAGEGFVYQSCQLAITAIITLLGSEALSIRVYTWNIMMFSILAGSSLGQGTQILVGHYVGAREHDKAYKICLKSFHQGTTIAFCVSLIIAIFGRNIISIFTHNPHIINIAAKLLWVDVILEMGRVFNMVMMNSLKAAGDVKFPVTMGIMSMTLTGVGLSYLLGIHFKLGLVGVWIAFLCDEWLRGVIALIRWKSRVWEQKNVLQ